MAFRYEMTGPGPENVVKVERDAQAPAPGEVQLRVRASSLNFHDLVTLSGLIPGIDYPRIPLSDGCGEITAVGPGVSAYAVGDRVLPLFHPLWQKGRPSRENKRLILGESMDGCMQELLCIDANSVVRAPHSLNDEQAASLVCAGHTAWYALVEEGQLQAGQTVLVQGSGGVSLFALQFAKAMGAKVVATSSSDDKLQRMQDLGADYTVNYREHPDWEQQVQQLTGGVDAVVDVGGEATLGKSVACTNTDGFIAVIGVLSGFGSAPVSIIEVMQKNLTIKGITVGCGESFDRMCRFVDEHNIVPCVSHSLPATELQQGLELMQTGQHFGKITIRID
ncbi:MAG: NADPH:quinone reductase-like Zn-dependent oxidoreductase [Halioglobus sp.]|jgi:NADPH:quinone reductase-like Zn-dependent oxidoreductase